MNTALLIATIALVSIIAGHGLVAWMGIVSGHRFSLYAPDEWEQDTKYGPLPDGSFRCHQLAGTGIIPKWVSAIQLIGFALRFLGVISLFLSLIVVGIKYFAR